ncbi:hypothetical protein MXD61_17100 [Frankia sp. AgPm24]|uniref:hypothetical protein n=1 Tax=Frankia sp. AgPm24 TaxID=631128 RepID=UPI00200BF754|nr:hypothetical protein [Frankia sp. AgPm24]MCK9923565.1 hypothetical protein [Frankia sp. AgPm24]
MPDTASPPGSTVTPGHLLLRRLGLVLIGETVIDILPGLKTGDSYPRGQVFLFH